jgi:hypothetical protein
LRQPGSRLETAAPSTRSNTWMAVQTASRPTAAMQYGAGQPTVPND